MAVTNAIPEMERELRFFPVENPHLRKLTEAQVRQFNKLPNHPLTVLFANRCRRGCRERKNNACDREGA